MKTELNREHKIKALFTKKAARIWKRDTNTFFSMDTEAKTVMPIKTFMTVYENSIDCCTVDELFIGDLCIIDKNNCVVKELDVYTFIDQLQYVFLKGK